MTPTNLPEGTDSIIEDSAVFGSDAPTPGFGTTGASASARPAAGAASSSSGTGASIDTKADKPTLDGIKADAKETIGEAKAKVSEGAAGLKDQATDKAREYALLGKDRASETLHSLSRMIDDAAATVDDKVGAQYGGYARQASGYVKSFAAGIDDKDIDELFEQGRDLIRSSPTAALGIAAALGFALTRVVKAGLETGVGAATSGTAGGSTTGGTAA